MIVHEPRSLTVATSKGKLPPYKEGEIPLTTAKRKRATDKLPVPPPKQAKIVADPKKDGIPVELQVQNRKPLTPEQTEAVERAMAKSRENSPAEKTKALRSAQKEMVKNAAKERREAKKAKIARLTAKPVTDGAPLTGKAALRAIAETAVQSGHPVTKVQGKADRATAKREARTAAIEKRAIKNLKKAGGKIADDKKPKTARVGGAKNYDWYTNTALAKSGKLPALGPWTSYGPHMKNARAACEKGDDKAALEIMNGHGNESANRDRYYGLLKIYLKNRKGK